MRYDIEKLLSEADCREVAEYIGMDMRRSGSMTRCECVNEEHIEGSYLTHATVYPQAFHCFSCGAHYNAIDMVLHYHAKNLNPIGFAEACGIVGDACGGKEMFVTEEDGTVNIKSQKKFPLSEEECGLIGLPLVSKWKPTYEGEKKPQMNLKMLFNEDEETFNELVRGKAAEYDERNRHCASVCDTSTEAGRGLKKAFEENSRKCRSICRMFGGTPQRINPYLS